MHHHFLCKRAGLQEPAGQLCTPCSNCAVPACWGGLCSSMVTLTAPAYLIWSEQVQRHNLPELCKHLLDLLPRGGTWHLGKKQLQEQLEGRKAEEHRMQHSTAARLSDT